MNNKWSLKYDEKLNQELEYVKDRQISNESCDLESVKKIREKPIQLRTG